MIKKILFILFVLFSLIQLSFAGISDCVELPPENQDGPSHPLKNIPIGGIDGKQNLNHPFCIDNNQSGGLD